MAGLKKAAASKSAKPVVKDNKARIAKRPACGFHRFRGGALNVTPKGGEKELVKSNQNSPLLQLPPEIRTRIWEFVLGGNLLRIGYAKDVYGPYQESRYPRPPTAESSTGINFLCVSRQVYSDCAFLPYKVNTFTFGHLKNVKNDLRNMKDFQRAQIVKIQLEVGRTRGFDLPFTVPIDKVATERRHGRYTLGFLPSLKHIIVLMFGRFWSNEYFETCENNVRDQLRILLAGRNVNITFKRTQEEWSDFRGKWDVEKPWILKRSNL